MPLLPDLRGLFLDLAAPVAATTALAQQHLFTALTQAMCALGGEAALLLCLDDLHLADDATLGWLHALAANPGAVLVMATATTITPPIDALRRLWRRSGRLAEATVAALNQEATQQLFAEIPYALAPALADRIFAVTDGNPFFMLEMV